MKTTTLSIRATGEIVTIHDDEICATLRTCGSIHIRRASHVEPDVDAAGRVTWSADMSPVGGPLLGPFPTRGEALRAETAWIVDRLATIPN